jgi:hypothetical protein
MVDEILKEMSSQFAKLHSNVDVTRSGDADGGRDSRRKARDIGRRQELRCASHESPITSHDSPALVGARHCRARLATNHAFFARCSATVPKVYVRNSTDWYAVRVIKAASSGGWKKRATDLGR